MKNGTRTRRTCPKHCHTHIHFTYKVDRWPSFSPTFIFFTFVLQLQGCCRPPFGFLRYVHSCICVWKRKTMDEPQISVRSPEKQTNFLYCFLLMTCHQLKSYSRKLWRCLPLREKLTMSCLLGYVWPYLYETLTIPQQDQVTLGSLFQAQG